MDRRWDSLGCLEMLEKCGMKILMTKENDLGSISLLELIPRVSPNRVASSAVNMSILESFSPIHKL